MTIDKGYEGVTNEKVDGAIDKAEKMLGVQMSDKAKKKLRDPSVLSSLIKSLSSEDISIISQAMKNPSIMKDEVNKSTFDKIKEKLEE